MIPYSHFPAGSSRNGTEILVGTSPRTEIPETSAAGFHFESWACAPEHCAGGDTGEHLRSRGKHITAPAALNSIFASTAPAQSRANKERGNRSSLDASPRAVVPVNLQRNTLATAGCLSVSAQAVVRNPLSLSLCGTGQKRRNTQITAGASCVITGGSSAYMKNPQAAGKAAKYLPPSEAAWHAA